MHLLKRILAEEDGQDMVEYGLVISLVVIAGAVAYQSFAGQINTGLATVGGEIANYL